MQTNFHREGLGRNTSAKLLGTRGVARMSGGKRNHEDLSNEMALLEAALKASRGRTVATHSLPHKFRRRSRRSSSGVASDRSFVWVVHNSANAASARCALRGSHGVQCAFPNEGWWAVASTGVDDRMVNRAGCNLASSCGRTSRTTQVVRHRLEDRRVSAVVPKHPSEHAATW